MKRVIYFKFISIIVFNLVCISAHAQSNPMRYGRIDPQDISMTEYEADPSANALVLGDFGKIEVRYVNNSGGSTSIPATPVLKFLTRMLSMLPTLRYTFTVATREGRNG